MKQLESEDRPWSTAYTAYVAARNSKEWFIIAEYKRGQCESEILKDLVSAAEKGGKELNVGTGAYLVQFFMVKNQEELCYSIIDSAPLTGG